MRLYIFGNGNLPFAEFMVRYHRPLSAAMADSDAHFLVCDFRGVDTLAMEVLKSQTPRVRVFHVGKQPRYLPDRYRTKVSQWELVGGFADDASRDAAAIAECTHFLAHDVNSSPERTSGTRRNIDRCLELGKTQLG